MKHKKIMSIVMASAMLLTSVPSSISSVFAKSADSSIQVTSETSSEDDIKVDSSSDISVTDGDSDIKVTPKESTDDITVNDKVDNTETTSESTESTDNANTEVTEDVTIESEFTSSVESKAKDKLSVGDTAKLHVKAENKSADTTSLKLYFADTDNQLTEDKTQWSGYITKPAMAMSIKGLNKECMLSVPVKTQDEKTMDASLKFLKEVKSDVVLSRYAVVELPAGASTEFDITIANTNEGSVSVIPVMEQKSVSFGDAATLTWKNDDGITIMDKIANTIVKDDKANVDDIQISDVQGAEKTVDDVDKSDFASKRLVAVADDKSVFTDADKVIGQYDNIYLLQYESVEDAKVAYSRLKDSVTAVEPDKDVTAASNVDETTTTSDATESVETTEANTESNDDVKVEDTRETDVPNAISALNDMDVSQPVQKEKGVIALIDTGVSESDNVIDRVSVIDDVLNGNGHGDKMLADILSQDEDAKVLSIRAMDDKGFGTISSLVAAMEYAIDQKVDYINLSLYARTTLTTSVLEQEIIKATKQGIIVIGAAGNDGADVKDYVPGSVMEAYIIGAAIADGTRLATSNFGDTVDYNVVAESTSDATALFTGYVSKNGLDSIADVLNKGFVYTPDYKNDGIDFEPIADDVDLSKYKVDDTKRFLVRYTFADRTKLSDGSTIDDLYTSTENMDALYGVFVDEPEVYDVGDGTYKIKANIPILNGYATHDYMDCDFARGNDYGEVVTDGVSIDMHTGIITVSKDVMDAASDKDYADLQAQILVAEDSVPERVIQDVTVEDMDGKTYSYKVPYFGLQNESVPISITGADEELTSDDFTVYLNNRKYPVLSDGVSWDEDNHIVRVNGAYAAVTSSVRVVINKKFDSAFQVAVSWDEFIRRASNNGNAISYSGMTPYFYLAEGTDVSGLTIGTSTTAMSYLSASGYDKMTLVGNEIGTMQPFDMASSGRPGHGGVDGDWNDQTFQVGTPKYLFDINFSAFKSDGSSWGDWDGYNRPLNGYCHHVSANIMNHGGDNARLHTVYYRVIDNYSKDGVTYITILCLTTEQIYKQQCGGGVFMIAVKNKQYTNISIKKTWSDQDNKFKKRPTSVTVNLIKDGKATGKTKTLTAANGWYAKWDNLVWKENGVEHSYNITENTTKGYTNGKINWTGDYSKGWVGTVTNTLDTGWLKLHKDSSLPDITNNNSCYNLKGAEYTVYTDSACKTKAIYNGSLVTDEDGNTGVVELTPGTYYVKETKATDDGHYDTDETVHKVKVTANNTKTSPYKLNVTETPLDDPAGITITKIWDGEETATIPTLLGTQFTVKYYAGTYTKDTLPKTATRTWVIGVKYDEKNKTYRAGLTDSYLVEGVSDALYKDADGGVVLPFGTYSIQETQAAKGYTLNGSFTDTKGNSISPKDVYVTQVLKKGDSIRLDGGNEYSSKDTPQPNDIKLVKYKADGKTPLAGVTYELKDHSGKVIGTKTTDKNGVVHFKDLYPDVYTVTETKAPNGYSLLKEPITVNCPMRVTDDDIKRLGIDKAKVTYDPADKIYYIFSQTFNVSNDWNFKMPQSGAMITAKRFIPIVCGMVVLMGATCVILFKRKKKRN